MNAAGDPLPETLLGYRAAVIACHSERSDYAPPCRSRSMGRHLFRMLGATVAVPALALASPDTTHLERFAVGTTAVSVQMPASQFSAGTGAVLAWIRRSMRIVSAYYGRFPTETLRIRLLAQDGDGVRTGTTWGDQGGFIRLKVGQAVSDGQMLNDWVLVHEMTHLALPNVGEEHAWLSEGLAVYVEGVARVQAGNRTQEDVFAEQMRSMPRGLPQAGDQGLDRTHTWGRTYWGGAMFCLLADVAIHRQTHNRFGLQDAMREVLRRSGGLSSKWSIGRTLQTADLATGTHVFEQLYAQMKDQPVTPDLPALWSQLGVQGDASGIRLVDDAPLADVRQAIMRPRDN